MFALFLDLSWSVFGWAQCIRCDFGLMAPDARTGCQLHACFVLQTLCWKQSELLFCASLQNHLPAARKAFDKFFTHYPYCYGYWKKYADLEKRHDNIKQSDEVRRQLDEAVASDPVSQIMTEVPQVIWLPEPAVYGQVCRDFVCTCHFCGIVANVFSLCWQVR